MTVLQFGGVVGRNLVDENPFLARGFCEMGFSPKGLYHVVNDRELMRKETKVEVAAVSVGCVTGFDVGFARCRGGWQ